MFVVEVGAVLATLALAPRRRDRAGRSPLQSPGRPLALVHGPLRELRRGGRRGARQGPGRRAPPDKRDAEHDRPSAAGRREESVPASTLRKGDLVVVEAGELIPGDGDVVEGIASVDESAITGESAPVIRESGGDRSAVTGGTKVLSDRIVVEITAEPGRDVPRPDDRARRGGRAPEDAERDRPRHPARGPDDRLPVRVRHAPPVRPLLGQRASRRPSSWRSSSASSRRRSAACSRPSASPGWTACSGTTSRDVGPGGRGRGRRRRAAPRQDRDDHARQPPGDRASSPRPASTPSELAERPSSPRLADETPEGRSIVVLAKEKLRPRGPRAARACSAHFVPFTAQTRMSGVDFERARKIRKGAADTVDALRPGRGRQRPRGGPPRRRRGSPARAGRPLVVADGGKVARRRSTSRTSSRAASRSGSTASGRWGSGRS